jgi:hypothetical protein
MLWRFADLAVASDVRFPGLPSAAGPAAVDVRRAPVAGEAWSPVQTWTGEAGEDWATIERGAGGYRIRFAELTSVIAADGSAIAYDPDPGTSEAAIVHLLLHQVLPLAVSRRGRMVVHACAVSTLDGVVAFVGGSGAGKSTLAAACCARGALLVADDALVVEFTADAADAWPTADGLRLWDDMALSMPDRAPSPEPAGGKRRIAAPLASDRAPLRRLVLVGDTSDRDAIVENVTAAEARVALLPHLFRLDVADKDESRRLFDDVHRLAARVPMRRLAFPDGLAHLEPAVDAVFGDLRTS